MNDDSIAEGVVDIHHRIQRLVFHVNGIHRILCDVPVRCHRNGHGFADIDNFTRREWVLQESVQVILGPNLKFVVVASVAATILLALINALIT